MWCSAIRRGYSAVVARSSTIWQISNTILHVTRLPTSPLEHLPYILYSFILANWIVYLECEQLIRRMLVLDPSKRYTIKQIKASKWMQSGVKGLSNSIVPHSYYYASHPQVIQQPANTANLPSDMPPFSQLPPNEPIEQILKLMANLGIDPVRTKEVCSINHLFRSSFIQ